MGEDHIKSKRPDFSPSEESPKLFSFTRSIAQDPLSHIRKIRFTTESIVKILIESLVFLPCSGYELTVISGSGVVRSNPPCFTPGRVLLPPLTPEGCSS